MVWNRRQRRALALGVALLLLAAVGLQFWIVDLYQIPQNGMYPGLPRGSRFLALKRPFHDSSEVRRGDVIVYVRMMPRGSYTFVWRVVGLPGDHVAIAGDTVTVNGQILSHQEVRRDGSMTVYRETNGDSIYEVAYHTPPMQELTSTALTVPADEFLVLGDNRDDARDSRFDGTVPFATIIARKFR